MLPRGDIDLPRLGAFGLGQGDGEYAVADFGLDPIGVEPLSEMVMVAQRNDAAGLAIVSDGDFAPEAWAFADAEGIVIIDREILTGLVVELTLGNALSTNLRAKARRLLSILQPVTGKWGVAATTH